MDNGLKGAVEGAVNQGAYVTDLERIRLNFLEWPNAKLVVGYVPEVLGEIETNSVAFLHLDLNAAYPESAAIEHFWPLLRNGAVVLLDDYAYGHSGDSLLNSHRFKQLFPEN